MAIASAGLVSFEGRAGTIQEVFQDAGNYYGRAGPVSPMVFVGVDVWTRTFPVDLLTALFSDADMLCLTDSIEDAVEFVVSHPPRPY